MGYQIYMREVYLRIRKENFDAALSAVKEALASDRTWTEHLESLEDAMSDFGYIPEYDEDGKVVVQYPTFLWDDDEEESCETAT